MLKNPGDKITLCGVTGCCPTVELTQDGAIMKDDFGGKVTLNKEEWQEFVQAVKKIK